MNIKLNPFVIFREEPDTTAILFDSENDKILSLNKTGRCVWTALEAGKNREEIIRILLDEFTDGTREGISQNLDIFLDNLRERGLISVED